MYFRALIEARFNRTITLALLRDTSLSEVVATLMQPGAYIVVGLVLGVALALWDKGRREGGYSEASIALFLLAFAIALVFFPLLAAVALPIAVRSIHRSVLDDSGADTKHTLRSAIVGGAVLFGGICLLMVSGMWLPVERVTTVQGTTTVGYVVREEPTAMVLRDSDRKLKDVGAIATRVPCRQPSQPVLSIFQRPAVSFLGLGADLPRCTT